MAEEIGIVINVSDGRARVRIKRTERCNGCHGCLLSEGKDYMTTEVADSFGAVEGDEVLIRTPDGSSAKSGLILYILPLVSFLFGYLSINKALSLLGYSSNEGWGILFGFLFMILTYLSIYLLKRKLFRTSSSQMAIVRIVKRLDRI